MFNKTTQPKIEVSTVVQQATSGLHSPHRIEKEAGTVRTNFVRLWEIVKGLQQLR